MRKEIQYLLFIVPPYVGLMMGTFGDMRTMFPLIFLLFAGCITGWAILNFKAIFKEQELFSYYNDGKHRAELAKDPGNFHFSMLYLMSGMLRADFQKGRQEGKIRFMIRYIHEVIPEEDQEEAIKMLDYLTYREAEERLLPGKKEVSTTHSIINTDAISNHREKDYFYTEVNNKGRFVYPVKDTEMAEELAKYIKQDDGIYIMYMLFKMSISENKVSKQEIEKIRRLCVDGMHISRAILDELIDALNSNRLDEWYQARLASLNRYPAQDKIANLYTHINAFQTKTEEKVTVPRSNNKNIGIRQRGEFASACAIVFFYFIYAEDHPSFWLIVVLSVITFICFCITNFQGPQLTRWGMLRTRTEISNQKNDIEFNFLLAAASSILCWVTFLNIALVMADKTYSIREFDKECYIDRSCVDNASDKTNEYYVVFAPVKASDTPPSEVRHTIAPSVKPLLDILPYISGYNIFGSPVCNGDINSQEVSRSDYYKVKDGANLIKLHIQESYYGRVYVGNYKICDSKNN